MAVGRMLSNDHVATMHETVGRVGIHYRRALRCTDTCHGRRVLALAVCFTEDVLSIGAKPIQTDNVHLRRRRTYMFLFHSKSREYLYC